jgi:hypothetical protein
MADRLLTTEDCAHPASAAAPRITAKNLIIRGADEINGLSERISLTLRSTHKPSAQLMDVMSYPQPEPPAQTENSTSVRSKPNQGRTTARSDTTGGTRTIPAECGHCATSTHGRRQAGMPVSRCLSLRTGQRDLAFGAEHIAVEGADPLAAARRHVEVTDFGLDVRRDAIPIELRVAVDDVGG